MTVSVEEDRIGDDMKETIYRVVQEGVSNAIRHGAPSRVEIAIVRGRDDDIRVEVTDDGIGMPDGAGYGTGSGCRAVVRAGRGALAWSACASA